MRNKLFFCLFIAGMMMAVGCVGPKGDESKDIIANSDTTSSNTGITEETTDPETEKKEPMPKTTTFYQGMLDYFCKSYYKEDFDWNYQEGSILVKQMDFKDEDEVFITGTHSYKDGLRKRGDREFKATVLRTGKNEYEVTFEKKSRGAGKTQYTWESSDHTIIYQ